MPNKASFVYNKGFLAMQRSLVCDWGNACFEMHRRHPD